MLLQDTSLSTGTTSASSTSKDRCLRDFGHVLFPEESPYLASALRSVLIMERMIMGINFYGYPLSKDRTFLLA